MIIADDGTDISENGKTSSLNGSGLKNMEMRAQNINAQFDIKKDNGFVVSIKMKYLT
jgi:signal transduction histidine kinase